MQKKIADAYLYIKKFEGRIGKYLLGYCQSVGVDLVDTPIVIASDKGSIAEFVPVKYILWLKLGVVQPNVHEMNKKKTIKSIKIN